MMFSAHILPLARKAHYLNLGLILDNCVVEADFFQRLSGNGGGGSGIAFGLTGEDAGYDDFVHGCGFFLHPDELGVTCMQRDRFVSDE